MEALKLNPTRPGFPALSTEEFLDRIAAGTYAAFPATITPPVARDLLDLNRHNRAPSKLVVNRYARDMADGHWQPRNGQSISFNAQGDLDNGQQRLMACVQSGKPFATLVVVGNDPDAFESIDKGKKRTPGDTLSVDDIAHPKSVAAILRLVWRHDHSCLNNPAAELPEVEIRSILEHHPAVIDAAAYTKTAAARGICRISNPTIVGFCHYAFHRVDPEAAARFFAAIETGANLDERHPALKLRNRLMASRQSRSRINNLEMLALWIKAWNYFRAGKPMAIIQWRSGGDNPEAFPTLEF